MYALIFTNTILGVYLSYIIAEKKKKSYRDKAFWLILFLLLTSIVITAIVMFPTNNLNPDNILLP